MSVSGSRRSAASLASALVGGTGQWRQETRRAERSPALVNVLLPNAAIGLEQTIGGSDRLGERRMRAAQETLGYGLVDDVGRGCAIAGQAADDHIPDSGVRQGLLGVEPVAYSLVG